MTTISPTHTIADDRQLACRIARAAGAELTRRFRRPLEGLESKSHAADYVSEADRSAEAAARAIIADARPSDAILGEEGGMTGEGERIWVIDPLDGTLAYVREMTGWSVSVALSDGEGGRVGVILDPIADELFHAGRDAGASLDSTELRPAHLATSLGEVTMLGNAGWRRIPADRAAELHAAADHLGAFQDRGSAALGCAWVAAGRADILYFEAVGLGRWDCEAGMTLCQAGGLVSGWLAPVAEGLPARFIGGPGDLVDQWLEVTGGDRSWISAQEATGYQALAAAHHRERFGLD